MLSGLVSILVMIGAIFIVGWIAVTFQLRTQKGLDQLSSREGLKWSEKAGSSVSFPADFIYNRPLWPILLQGQRQLGRRMYGLYHGYRINIVEVLWRFHRTGRNPSFRRVCLCASTIDAAMPDFLLTPRPLKYWFRPAPDELGRHLLPFHWILRAPDHAALKGHLSPGMFRCWIRLNCRVQSRGGQLLICLPDRPWRLARLSPGNASRLLQALAALPPK